MTDEHTEGLLPVAPPDDNDMTITLWDRPETTNRECTICGAIVAAWPEAMCCHCQTVPWRTRQPSTPVPDDGEVERLREALEPFVSGAAHTRVFLTSREKMHSAGIALYDEDVERARAALTKEDRNVTGG